MEDSSKMMLTFLIVISFSFLGLWGYYYKSLVNDYNDLGINYDTLRKNKMNLEKEFTDLNISCGEIKLENQVLASLPLFNMNPTLKQVKKIVNDDKINEISYEVDTFNCVEFTNGLVNTFLKQKVHACLAWVIFKGDNESSHAIVAVDTSDEGVIYIEPQTDEMFYGLKVGDNFCSVGDCDDSEIISKIKSCYSNIYDN